MGILIGSNLSPNCHGGQVLGAVINDYFAAWFSYILMWVCPDTLNKYFSLTKSSTENNCHRSMISMYYRWHQTCIVLYSSSEVIMEKENKTIRYISKAKSALENEVVFNDKGLVLSIEAYDKIVELLEKAINMLQTGNGR